MHAQVNGSEMSVEPHTTIAKLVAQLTGSEEQRGIAVACNGEVVPRSQWAQLVEERDAIEIVKAVQGG